MEYVKDKNLEAILIFIDFKKACDTIHRGKMFTILKAYRIREKLVTAISIMYGYTTAKVISQMDKRKLSQLSLVYYKEIR